MTTLSLADRIVAIHRALARVQHAFGGAIALAYYAEPRATIDVDLNMFVPPEEYERVARPLGKLGADVDDPNITEAVTRNGQVRVFWDTTPIDLFFAYDAFHDAAALHRKIVPFANGTIPILAVEHLVVCKVVFDRPRDWIDIDAIVAAGTFVDVAEVLRWTGRILGDDDPRYDRIGAVLSRTT